MTHSMFICRRLKEEELSAGAKVVFEAFNDFSDRSGTPGIPEPEIVLTRLHEYTEDTGIPGLMYGCFEESELVGFMMLRKLGIDEEAWEISMLSIVPERQGQGLGRRMVEYGLQEILNFRGVLAVCAVTEENHKALRLLAGQGFESEASGIPVGENMTIWMLRKDMTNQMAARAAAQEAADDPSEHV